MCIAVSEMVQGCSLTRRKCLGGNWEPGLVTLTSKTLLPAPSRSISCEIVEMALFKKDMIRLSHQEREGRRVRGRREVIRSERKDLIKPQSNIPSLHSITSPSLREGAEPSVKQLIMGSERNDHLITITQVSAGPIARCTN